MELMTLKNASQFQSRPASADGVLYSMIGKKKGIFVQKSQNLVVGSRGSECWCEKCVFLVTGCQESLQRLHSFTGETWTEH